MVKNLVTGGSGFLGSHLVNELLERGETVRVLVRPTSKVSHLNSLGVELVIGDTSDIKSLRTAIEGVERVYHVAALVADWGPWEAFYAANVTGVHNLLELAREARVDKFIHISTTDVYGHPDYPADETAPYRFRGWPYGDTKIEGEQLVWAYYRQYDLPVTIVRPASIYGPRSISLVQEIVEFLKGGGMIHVGSGNKPAGLAHVANVVNAIVRAAESEISKGQAYNVSDGSDITWRQYVNRLAEIVGVPHPRIVLPYRMAYLIGWAFEKAYGALHIKNRPLMTRMTAALFGTNQGFSVNKARRELGYEPEIDFDEGMRSVAMWLHQIDHI
jgi:nucleoside-diphosphate-sugar epimerase